MNNITMIILAVIISITVMTVADAAEVQPPKAEVHYLSDGTRCISSGNSLSCDWKHGELIRELKYLYGYIGSLQAELKKRKYLNS